ncbi:MAG TPA: hypothetical protein VGP93_03695, partial [Polyangiaceae bacterium]|nr:hypothetical protein [Polyangiaceae bacterium]
MPRWKVSFDEERRVHRHKLPRGFGHAILSPTLTAVFRTLRVSASLTDGSFWWPLHVEPNVLSFEGEHGVLGDRQGYNQRSIAAVRRSATPLRGEHAGYFDLFVPVVFGGQVEAILISGPFAQSRPNSGEILERWRALTGRQGHPADPEFAAYLLETLRTLVLDAESLVTFERLLVCVAGLMAGEKPAAALMNEAEALYLELWETRHVERTWEAVQGMVDDRFPRSWHGADHADPLRILGLTRVPDHVLVGLTLSRAPELEPVDEAIRRDAFQ